MSITAIVIGVVVVLAVLVAMALFASKAGAEGEKIAGSMFGAPQPLPVAEELSSTDDEQPHVQAVVRAGFPVIDRAKVDANVRRFTIAIEQNTKGKLRERELKDNLEYWRLQDKALRMRGE